MLPRQPYSRFGSWHTVDPAGHEDGGCIRDGHRVGQACMRSLRVDVLLHQVRACVPAVMARPCRRWMECLHRERLQPDLTQRDMWVMHSPSGDTLLSPPPSGDTLLSPPPSGDTLFSPPPSGDTLFSPPPNGYALPTSHLVADTMHRCITGHQGSPWPCPVGAHGRAPLPLPVRDAAVIHGTTIVAGWHPVMPDQGAAAPTAGMSACLESTSPDLSRKIPPCATTVAIRVPSVIPVATGG